MRVRLLPVDFVSSPFVFTSFHGDIAFSSRSGIVLNSHLCERVGAFACILL